MPWEKVNKNKKRKKEKEHYFFLLVICGLLERKSWIPVGEIIVPKISWP